MFKMGVIHIGSPEVWEPPKPTKEQREAFTEALNKVAAERSGWRRTITPQECGELWNGGRGIDHPNVIEGEYRVVVDQTG
jgi:hypothetical protein